MVTLHKLCDFEEIYQRKIYYSLQDNDNVQPQKHQRTLMFCVQKLHFRISFTKDNSLTKSNRSFKQKLVLKCKYFENFSSAKISSYK